MSKINETRRITVPNLRARKGGEPIVSLTAYTAPVARILDGYCDFLLVGDSLGMVVYGLPDTLGVSLDMMIAHGAAVVRSTQRACVVVDLPFGTYEANREEAFRNAARVLRETGCAAVKLEGGLELADTIRFLVERGIPVMGHIGLRPQQVQSMGGFRVQGRDAATAERLKDDAFAVADAGAFAVVIEGTVEPLAREVTGLLPIPTIGIGASSACDGQILVTDDLLGLFAGFTPKFVKRYAELADEIGRAAQAYAADVKARRFPGPEHTYGASKG
jgi:3-methyl-2-oxobutanoate hydroxymethyltransferase